MRADFAAVMMLCPERRGRYPMAAACLVVAQADPLADMRPGCISSAIHIA